MSSSSEVSETASGNKTIPTMEKSSFSKTCNRLREYLKDKGSLGDVSLGIAPASDTGFGVKSATACNGETQPGSLSSMNLFPQGCGAKAGIEDLLKFGDYRCDGMKPEKAPMTIFYGGQVMIFDDMPAGHAMEVMRLATVAASQATGNPVPAAAGLGLAPHERADISRNIPIARKQSLARFLEKRKDRIMARSPYGVCLSPPADKSWLGLAGS